MVKLRPTHKIASRYLPYSKWVSHKVASHRNLLWVPRKLVRSAIRHTKSGPRLPADNAHGLASFHRALLRSNKGVSSGGLGLARAWGAWGTQK